MSQLSKSTFDTTYVNTSGTFQDNTTRNIDEGDLRQFSDDIVDSAMFLSDNFIDEDSFASDSATKAPSQQSTKAYIASQIGSISNSVSVLIDTADILTGNSVPYQVIAAPGAGMIIQPVSIEVSYDFVSAAFATNTVIVFTINGVEVTVTNTTLIAQTADYVAIILPVAVQSSVATLANQPLKFFVKTGDPTGGGNSAIRVNILYRTISTVV